MRNCISSTQKAFEISVQQILDTINKYNFSGSKLKTSGSHAFICMQKIKYV